MFTFHFFVCNELSLPAIRVASDLFALALTLPPTAATAPAPPPLLLLATRMDGDW